MKSLLAIAIAIATAAPFAPQVEAPEALEDTIVNEADQTCEAEEPTAQEAFDLECLQAGIQCTFQCGSSVKNPVCYNACMADTAPQCL